MDASRRDEWAAALAEHVAAVEAGQARLGGVLGEKRRALIDGDAARIEALCREETGLADAFGELASARHAMLRDAAAEGLRPASLAELAGLVGVPEELAARIEAARSDAARLQGLNATQRLVAQRASRHYAELVDLIANAGRKAEAYGQKEATGGGLLDAAA